MMKMRECLEPSENPNPVSGRRQSFVPSLVSLRQPSTPTFAVYTHRPPRAPNSSNRNISSRPAPSSSRPAASARKEFKAKHVIGTSRASSSRSSRTRSRWRRFRPRARSPSTRRRRSRSRTAYAIFFGPQRRAISTSLRTDSRACRRPTRTCSTTSLYIDLYILRTVFLEIYYRSPYVTKSLAS